MAKHPKTPSKPPAEPPAAPAGDPVVLRGAAADLHTKVTARWQLDEVASAILLCACQSLQRAEDAAAIATRDGLVVYDRFGAPRNHPAALLERDHRNAAANSLQKLGLSLDG
jgi:hypothetical protein